MEQIAFDATEEEMRVFYDRIAREQDDQLAAALDRICGECLGHGYVRTNVAPEGVWPNWRDVGCPGCDGVGLATPPPQGVAPIAGLPARG